MSLPTGNGVQTPLNLILPIKSWLGLQELDAILHLKLQQVTKDADTVGTLHFGRFFNFHDNNQMGFFTVYDGKFEDYMHDFLKYLAPIFNFLNDHVVDPCPSPVEKNADAWLKWTTDRDLESIGFYSAYPTLSVQDIRTRAGVSQGSNKPNQSPLTLVLRTKSPQHLAAASQLITNALPQFYGAADAMGTLHFARFVPMGTTALVLIAEYDGNLNKLIQDLATRVGPTLDQLLENVVDPPTASVQKDTPAFTSWVTAHNITPWTFYAAYPTLSVQDVLRKAKAA
jgi:hypothetical protein